ncbi:hypothetical protein GRI75_02340 [Altererythrobacter soli]|uniref:Uncharacterized protein n=1 Tax=Croceibacterium soli TaxID=1739690 RepID=A0A6I4UTM8_9SPHN|nr:hypothetical protein [Croceibacterium soli]MXP40485.1 hypothetical protein [Croceibacterium soli]
MNLHPAAGDSASIFRLSRLEDGASEALRQRDLQYLRASGLAQTRLQLAVLTGDRRRALEQIDRLVAIDKQLERLALGQPVAGAADVEADLTDQRLAIATEKLALTSGIAMPRLEPAFASGPALSAVPEEDEDIVEHEALKNRLFHILLWGLGFILLCLGVTAAVLVQF